jgi:hypothetical protein
VHFFSPRGKIFLFIFYEKTLRYILPERDTRLCKNKRKRNASLFKTLPRSQAIYGGSVETFGPYPQDYTMQLIIYSLNSIFILAGNKHLVNKNTNDIKNKIKIVRE